MTPAGSQFRNTAKASALFLMLVGTLYLGLSILQISVSGSDFAQSLSLPPSVATCLLCSGWALWLLLRRTESAIARAMTVSLASVVLATGLAMLAATAAEHLLGSDVHLVSLASRSDLTGIALSSILEVCISATALLLMSLRKARAARALAVGLSISSGFTLLAFVYGAPSLYGGTPFGAQSLAEAVGFFALGFGLFFADPSSSTISLLTSRRPSGWLTRTLLTAALGVPFVVGVFATHWSRFNDSGRMTATVLVFVQMVVFSLLTCISTLRLAVHEEEEVATRHALAASERMLQESQKIEAIGVLAGGLAHDFNNLLNVISGYSELLLNDSSLREIQRSKVEKIAKAGQTAAGLTRQLLAFSRKQVLQPQALDLNEVIRSKDGYLHRLIKENVEFSTSLDPGLMATLIDPTQLEQILLNLVINASDAMPQGGRLTITTTNMVLEEQSAAEVNVKPGSYVRLAITDTGTGMDEPTRLRIFEPFFTTKVVGKGTGLGLATVYGIVKQSGGFIQVESKVGRGTTFLVYLPATRVAVSDQASSAISADSASTGTILVVEDSELLRELVFETLESMGYTVLMAKEGREAIRICNQFSGTIDLVLSDVVMPKMNGPEVVKKIKEIRPDVAVLFMSGYTDEITLRRGQNQSGARFLQKPFSSSDLRNKVRDVLVQAQERRNVRQRLSTAMVSEAKSLQPQDLD